MGFCAGDGILLRVQIMKCFLPRWSCLLTAALLAVGLAFNSEAKSYSGGGGHSYSSHSSSSGGSHSFSSGSHSFSSGSSHSSSGGSSHSSSSGSTHSSGSSSGGGKSFSSGAGRSYSSGSSSSDSGRHSYTSGKSYSAGSDHTFSSSSGNGHVPKASKASTRAEPDSGAPSLNFDTAAAHARKEEASKSKFTQFKDSQVARPSSPTYSQPSGGDAPSYRVKPPPISGSGGGYYDRSRTYIPDVQVIRTRPVRIYNVFNPYASRPWVVYNDPYNSLFWWWLLDRSLDDRAWWAYHHRYDMDPARYQALVATDQQLETRVQQLEAQQAPRDPNYVPTGLDRDLMYSDQYVTRAYSNRPTTLGVITFWALGVPMALTFVGFFIWLIWFKRWQTAT
jgi:hypothetical protein